ncbi:threonine/serine dehydratase [Acetobacter sp. TBRC 12305]|uniref:Threonine/serine dehydratase n=1 Tax=Acetobacter garciniae TaxID=2817435 RepID=A0A939HPJ8_9PROT|nr:threonine/serine dehydratase [Acetobacter garciniae]MBO1325417.1 threonine/serine dehydratase [Acetobacter garciniae]MBX0345411.1 threonine/serine dehydratase [Acetobacter garciniae]
MMSCAELRTLDFAEIFAASIIIRDYIVKTPLIENAALNERLGGRVLIKPEMLQITGSFKFRGACNRILQMTENERRGGVVAWSSGNHALAVSAVCAQFGIPAYIIMPETAPRMKIDGARHYGAKVRLYDRATETREDIGREIAEREGAVIVPPYDDLRIMAGQGTIGLEIMEQCRVLGITPDNVLASASGGGLVAGVGTAVRTLNPLANIYSVEPAGFDDLSRSLASGQRVDNAPGATTLCDSLMVGTPGELTFETNRNLLSDGLVVNDSEVKLGMSACFEHFKLVAEPGGAAPLAAILSGKIDVRDKVTVAVLSGGNVDPAVFSAAL